MIKMPKLRFEIKNKQSFLILMFSIFIYIFIISFKKDNIFDFHLFFKLNIIIIVYFFIFYNFLNIKKEINKIFNKGKFGRKLVMLTFILISVKISIDLFDQEKTYFDIFLNNSIFLPILFFFLIIKDIVSYDEKIERKDITQKVNKKINWSQERIDERSYSFENIFLNFNGLNPLLLYYFSLFYSETMHLVYNLNISVFIPIIIITIIYLFIINKNTIIMKITSIISFIIIILFAYTFSSFYYKDKQNPFEDVSGLPDTSYSATRIGKDKNVEKNIQELLFRVNWKDKDTNLLPTSFYNYYNERENNWLISAELRSYKIISPEQNTVSLFDVSDLDFANFEFIKNQILSENIIYKKNEIIKPNYNFVLNNKDKRSLSIIGRFNKLEKLPYILPLPYNTKYIYSENINNNNFYQYTSNTLSMTGNVGNKDIMFFYDVYNNNQYNLTPPVDPDLMYHKMYQESIINIIELSDVKKDDSLEVKVNKIINYFQNNYTYTLDNHYKETDTPRSLMQFLTEDKRGHCEYFATAMSFSLRELGVPARYTVGYMVSENRPNENKNMYWVRKKDAHAWVTYWNGQAWETADATPYSQEEIEEFGKPSFIKDKIEELKFYMNNLEINIDIQKEFFYMIIFLILILIILRRLRKKDENIFYYEDIMLKRFKRKIKKFEKIHPKKEGELYLSWALRINDQNLIKLVKKYYTRYNRE